MDHNNKNIPKLESKIYLISFFNLKKFGATTSTAPNGWSWVDQAPVNSTLSSWCSGYPNPAPLTANRCLFYNTNRKCIADGACCALYNYACIFKIQ